MFYRRHFGDAMINGVQRDKESETNYCAARGFLCRHFNVRNVIIINTASSEIID
jgi:hypothetical protein